MVVWLTNRSCAGVASGPVLARPRRAALFSAGDMLSGLGRAAESFLAEAQFFSFLWSVRACLVDCNRMRAPRFGGFLSGD